MFLSAVKTSCVTEKLFSYILISSSKQSSKYTNSSLLSELNPNHPTASPPTQSYTHFPRPLISLPYSPAQSLLLQFISFLLTHPWTRAHPPPHSSPPTHLYPGIFQSLLCSEPLLTVNIQHCSNQVLSIPGDSVPFRRGKLNKHTNIHTATGTHQLPRW